MDPLDRLDAMERAALAFLDECRALRKSLQDLAPAPLDSSDTLIPIATAAQLLGVSKNAIRKQATRRGLTVFVGNRLHIYRSALSEVYPRRPATLAAPLATLTSMSPSERRPIV